jgi:ADP-heptose:LPS heptosyltransferase
MHAGADAIVVRTSIREMMALLKQCDMLLCNDSGPMHIAAALGVPVVAVFRTGDPSAYGPRGMNHTLVGSGAPWGSTTEVELEEVASAADAALAGIVANRNTRPGRRA